MANHSGFNEQYRQQAQYLNLRGAQMAERNTGKKTELGSQPKAHGSKKQLIGTIVGIAAGMALLVVLSLMGR